MKLINGIFFCRALEIGLEIWRAIQTKPIRYNQIKSLDDENLPTVYASQSSNSLETIANANDWLSSDFLHFSVAFRRNFHTGFQSHTEQMLHLGSCSYFDCLYFDKCVQNDLVFLRTFFSLSRSSESILQL